MFRVLALVIVATFAAPVSAQVPKFKWASGQVLVYRVAQVTKATETVGEKKSETSTRLDSVKRWKVESVDSAGVATLTMSFDRLRMSTQAPTGESMRYDSADPSKSDPALRDEMSKYVGVPVVTVRLDARGQLVEVKESKFGSANRLEAELPFKIVLPATAMATGQSWERKFAIKMEQGESYNAVQKITCKSVQDSTAVLSVATTISNPPENAADRVSLLPLQPSGEAIFDLATGRVINVKYQFAHQVRGQQGEGSNYAFASSYVEELVP